MGIDYTYSCFYGVELAVDRVEFYEIQDRFDYSGPASVSLFGNFMYGDDPKPAAYIKSTSISSDSDAFGLFRLEESEIDLLAFNNLLRKSTEGIPIIGKPGWFFAASVS